MEKLPKVVEVKIEAICGHLGGRPKLAKMFRQCFPNTLETTTELEEDGTTYVFTGDIPAMWLRDSTAQVRHYVPLAREDGDLQRIIEGLIRRQIEPIGAALFNLNIVRLDEIATRAVLVDEVVTVRVSDE